MESLIKQKVTVQGVGSPVPATVGGEQAGPRSSISSNRNVTAVANLAAVADNFTSRDSEERCSIPMSCNPFGKSGLLNRSPTKSASVNDLRSTSTLNSITQPIVAEGTQTQKMQFLKGNIEALQDYVKDRNNVHQEIKRLIRIIKQSYNNLEKDLISPKEECKVEASTQTDDAVRAKTNKPSGKHGAVTEALPKRQREPSTETPIPFHGSKRPKGNTTQRQVEEDPRATTPKQSGTPPQINKPKQTCEEWRTVAAKVKKKKPTKGNHPKPEAIVIKANGDTSYADILRKVKTDTNLKDLGENVFRIRRTQKGEMLFELKNQSLSTTYKAHLETALGNDASVRAMTQDTMLIIKHLDEITTEDEICTGVAALTNGIHPSLKWIAKGYSGTQTAGISLPTTSAITLLEIKKVKIGWSICTIKEYIQPKRCFRCMGFLHNARDCKGIDRSKRCRKCGIEGHFANVCKNDLNCMLCSEMQGQPSNHACGSSRCPEYKRAIQQTSK